MKVVSLFSGAGGLDLGFKNSGYEIVWANEFDKYAGETYKLNLGEHIHIEDIKKVNIKLIPKADILIGGFPCQPFSIAGYQKGFEDERGELFWQIIRVAKKVKPRVIVLENVKNLVSHDNGNTFKIIVETLEKKGYKVKSQVMNSNDFGVPQGRQRIFIVAFKKKIDFEKFQFPDGNKKKSIYTDIKFEKNVNNKYFYTFGKYYELLKKSRIDTVLQIRRHYIRENAKQLFPTLTANMGTGGHNVPIIYDNYNNVFRKITPREAFVIQGFPLNYKLSTCMSDGRLYKQAGNAVSVPVATAVADKIREVITND